MSLINTINFITNHPINRKNKLSSIFRFIKWQVGSRLVPGAVVFDWINGAKFLIKTGETGLSGNIYTGLHEFSDMGYLLHVLRSEDLFVDVGANVGSYTILACSAIGAKGIAFEPVPSTYNRLMMNIRLNNLKEEYIKCINKGIGAEPGSISFTCDSDTTNHVLALNEKYDNAVNVEVTSLDIALNDYSPSVLKIDVEGYETPVLQGAKEIMQKQTLHSVIMELNGSGNRYGYDESQIIKLMLDYGFKTYSYNPFDRKLINLEGKNLNSGNTLFIRDIEFVEERLKTAPNVTIYGKTF